LSPPAVLLSSPVPPSARAGT